MILSWKAINRKWIICRINAEMFILCLTISVSRQHLNFELHILFICYSGKRNKVNLVVIWMMLNTWRCNPIQKNGHVDLFVDVHWYSVPLFCSLPIVQQTKAVTMNWLQIDFDLLILFVAWFVYLWFSASLKYIGPVSQTSNCFGIFVVGGLIDINKG